MLRLFHAILVHEVSLLHEDSQVTLLKLIIYQLQTTSFQKDYLSPLNLADFCANLSNDCKRQRMFSLGKLR